MIDAIGIYTTDTKCSKFTRQDSTPKDKGGFFAFRPLGNLEKKSLPELHKKVLAEKKVDDVINIVKCGAEYHYFKKLKGEANIVLAFIAKEEFQGMALKNLFANINAVRLGNLTVTLEDIRTKTGDYSRKTKALIEVEGKVGSVKVLLHDSIKKAVVGEEKLEDIQNKSNQLEGGSKQFYKQAKKVKRSSCCCC